MSESSGFFTSQGGDRKYTPDWLAGYIKAIITTGVFKDECGVTAADGMTVSVAPGRAWVEGYLYLLDTRKTLQISNADGVLGRLDIVVLRLDMTARAINVHVVTGTPSASPKAPALTRNSDVYELELAEISVPAGTISITQELVRDTRLDDTVCGITVCAVDHIPTVSFLGQMWAEFNTWFNDVKGILGEDEAGKLYGLIRALSYTKEFEAEDWTEGDDECTITIPADEHVMTGDTVSCHAFMKDAKTSEYRQNTWGAMMTYATLSENGDIVVHYPDFPGYSGKVVLNTYRHGVPITPPINLRAGQPLTDTITGKSYDVVVENGRLALMEQQ